MEEHTWTPSFSLYLNDQTKDSISVNYLTYFSIIHQSKIIWLELPVKDEAQKSTLQTL